MHATPTITYQASLLLASLNYTFTPTIQKPSLFNKALAATMQSFPTTNRFLKRNANKQPIYYNCYKLDYIAKSYLKLAISCRQCYSYGKAGYYTN